MQMASRLQCLVESLLNIPASRPRPSLVLGVTASGFIGWHLGQRSCGGKHQTRPSDTSAGTRKRSGGIDGGAIVWPGGHQEDAARQASGPP